MKEDPAPNIDEQAVRKSWAAHARALFMEAMFRGLRCFPLSAVSAFGASLGHLFALQADLRGQLWFKRIQRNILALSPQTSPRDARASAYRLLRNSGRVTAEFSVVDRFAPAGRVRIVGGEHVDRRTRPVMLIGLHLGNWEIACLPLCLKGIPVTALYGPPADPTVHRLAVAARNRLLSGAEGSQLIAASPRAMRQLVRAAEQRQNLLIYVDEERAGLIWNPPLGRSLPYRGNRMMAARMALKYGYEILPTYVIRKSGAHFDVIVGAPLEFSATGDALCDSHRLADEISAHNELWVRDHLDQWYWLPELRLERKFPPDPSAPRTHT